jgi:hypothetical protein
VAALIPGWCIVTKARLPLLHGVLEDVSHDAGGCAGHESYQLPGRWEHRLPVFELALHTLSGEELTDFAIGEEADQARVVKSEALAECAQMLEDFFDNCGDENDDLHREQGTYRG